MDLNLNWNVHSSLKGDPGDLLLINLSKSVVALCLYLSERWAMASIRLYMTHSLPQSVPSSYWKNTRRLVIGIYTIVIGSSLFTKGRKPHLWYTLGQSIMRVRRHIQVPSGQETTYPPKSHQHKAVCILHISHRASAENITLEFQTVSGRVMPLVLQVWQKCLNCLLNLPWHTQANWIHHIVIQHCFKRQISC